eukprot:1065574-Alexandrium_andersonii.AAC.1
MIWRDASLPLPPQLAVDATCVLPKLTCAAETIVFHDMSCARMEAARETHPCCLANVRRQAYRARDGHWYTRPFCGQAWLRPGAFRKWPSSNA